MCKLHKILIMMYIPICYLCGYTLNYSQSHFPMEIVNGYSKFKTQDFALSGNPGSPELPSIYLNYIIPATAKVDSVVISQLNTIQIAGSYSIYPAQPPRLVGHTGQWVPPDTSIYNSNELFPGEYIDVVNQGTMDGARIVTVVVHPIQYKPKNKTLFVMTDINFSFASSSTNIPEIKAKIRGEFEQTVYDKALSSILENDYEMNVYYQRPVIVKENQLGRGKHNYPVGPSIIITPSAFSSYFQPYADWLTDQGIRTYLITPSTIYRYFSGRDNPERIRNYIKYCYQNCGGTYFFFGGDTVKNTRLDVPFRKCVPLDSPPHTFPNQDTIIPTDLYYADLGGEWNADSDSWWGELTNDSADRFPEVFVGRVLPYCTTEIKNWSEKVLKYEQGRSNLSGLDTAIIIWHKTGYTGHPAWFLMDTTIFPSHITHIVGEDLWADSALGLLNRGYGMTNVNCHGGTWMFCTRNLMHGDTLDTGFVFWYKSSSPTQYWAGLNWQTNASKPFLHYSVACKNAYYDNGSDTCITDAFLDAYCDAESDDPLGSAANVSHTRWSWGPGNSITLQNEFYRQLFSVDYTGPAPPEPGLERLGVAVAMSKCQESINWNNWHNRFVCYATNLFGSPTTDAWTKEPKSLTVTHPSSITEDVQTNFTVTVKDYNVFPPAAVAYAKVCLNKPGDIYEVEYTNTSGQYTFTITPGTTGYMRVTVTRLHNFDSSYKQYLPYRDSCQVVEADGKRTVKNEDIGPDKLSITQMPTLFKKETQISFGIPIASVVEIIAYDITGSRVKTVIDKHFEPGYYEETIDAGDLSRGVYFIILRQNGVEISKKFILIE